MIIIIQSFFLSFYSPCTESERNVTTEYYWACNWTTRKYKSYKSKRITRRLRNVIEWKSRGPYNLRCLPVVEGLYTGLSHVGNRLGTRHYFSRVPKRRR